jgi:G:T-mismatch repair DNA endonuclease (very short patch repair protein)
MDIFTPEKRSEIMRGIPNKNTKPELLMRKTLHALGWQEKIKANMIRDVKVNKQLESAGWKVFRVWQKDLQKEPVKHARYIYEYIRS